MDSQSHWENVYRNKPSTSVSWFRPRLDHSLGLIRKYGPERGGVLVDVGGGASTLVDDLTREEELDEITVVDLSSSALRIARERLSEAGGKVRWVTGDACRVDLPSSHFDLWHDRAVFHFLTREEDRTAYVEQAFRCLKPNGVVIIATFGPDGPLKCSDLEVVRYDAPALARAFGPRFTLVEEFLEIHHTPAGKDQQFQVCVLRREA